MSLCAGLNSCAALGGSHDAQAELQEVLDGRAAAVREGDEGRFLATVDPEAREFRSEQRKVFRNVRRLPLADWDYEITGLNETEEPSQSRPDKAGGDAAESTDGKRTVVAEARLRYQLRGYDRDAVTETEKLGFIRRKGHWYLFPADSGGQRQLWELGEVSVVRGERSLVIGVGRSPRALRPFARAADRAVSVVGEAWPREWPRKLVLEVPPTLKQMALLLDSPPATYQGIAAVTTGQSEKSEDAPADRIVVNPEAYGTLSPEGKRVVMVHEAVHVATRQYTNDNTPLWLSEGIADWIGYRGTERTTAASAPELARHLDGAGARRGVPARLPSDADFRFGNDPQQLGRAYESSWLVCRMIAERWGERRLIDLYLAVSEGEERDVDRAVREVLGVSEAELTEQWRSYVERELR